MFFLLYDEFIVGFDFVVCMWIEDLIVKIIIVVQGCLVVVSYVCSMIECLVEWVVMFYDGQFQWEGLVDVFCRIDNFYVVQFRMGSLCGLMQFVEY